MADQPLESGNVAARPESRDTGPPRSSSEPTKNPLATRVAGFATNILATGLILILGAVGGQQALQWWSAARQTATTTATPDALARVVGPGAVQRRQSSDGVADEPTRHMLAFGDDPLLATRTELRGDTRDALARLRDDCRLMAERTTRVQRTPGPAEQRMLTQIRRQKPIESTSRWRMYQIETPVPLVVTVLDQPTREAAGRASNVAAVESRVVSWGLAFPAVSDEDAPGDRWTLFTLTTENPRLDPITSHRDLPLPPRIRRTMSLQAESGAIMVGFRGTGSIHAWQVYYDRELAAPAWTPTSNWRHDGPIWQRSFTSPRDGRLDVQLIEEADGSLNGLLMSAPPTGRAMEK